MTDRDEEKWLDWRRGGITATDIADAANGTYGGAYGVIARKLGLVTVESNQFMDRGHRWQERIADAVHALTGSFVVGEEAWCENADDTRWRATVDGFLAELPEVDSLDDVLGVVEIKTRGRNVRPNRDRWADQVQWQMLVTGTAAGLIAEATIVDDLDPDAEVCDGVRLTEISADPARQQFLVGLAEQLWAHMVDGTLPVPDDPSALDAVKRVHSVAPDDDTADLAALADDVRRFTEIKQAVKAVTDEHDLLEARIREAVGDHNTGTCPGYQVAVSAPANVLTRDAERALLDAHPEFARQVLDRDLVKEVAPALYEAARQPLGARRLTVKEI